jgi:hypothetical protein
MQVPPELDPRAKLLEQLKLELASQLSNAAFALPSASTNSTSLPATNAPPTTLPKTAPLPRPDAANP